MGFADGLFFGRPILVCELKDSSKVGQTVTATSGTKSYTGVVGSDGMAVINLPQKGVYTVSIGSVTRHVPISYGECKHVVMDNGYINVDTISTGTTAMTSGTTALADGHIYIQYK